MGISYLSNLFHISRQGYYKQIYRSEKREKKKILALAVLRQARTRLPYIGIKKIYHKYNGTFTKIGIGRDSLFHLAKEHGLLQKRRRKRILTTDSGHSLRIYPNHLKEREVSEINQAYVSDITYIGTYNGFCYLSLVVDKYSRKILGKSISNSLETTGVINALKEAISPLSNTKGILHHSDRGIQYSSKSYVELVESNGMVMSMSRKGNPYDNAIAERIFCTLKHEFGLKKIFSNIKEASRAIKDAIKIYNSERPHWSLGLMTPDEMYFAKKSVYV